MHEVFATVGQVANCRATVLLLGETGTGKEMIAKAIHYNSPRQGQAVRPRELRRADRDAARESNCSAT